MKSLPPHACEFAHPEPSPSNIGVRSSLLCGVCCLLLNTTQFKTGYNGFIYPILSALAFGIFSIRLSKIGCFETLTAKILIRIGRVSFSMYLIHFFPGNHKFYISKNNILFNTCTGIKVAGVNDLSCHGILLWLKIDVCNNRKTSHKFWHAFHPINPKYPL